MAGVKSSGTALDEITIYLATAASLRDEIKRLEAAAVDQEKLAERQAEDVFGELAPHFLEHASSGRNVEAVQPQVKASVSAIMGGREPSPVVVSPLVSPAVISAPVGVVAPLADAPRTHNRVPAPEPVEDREMYGVKVAASNLELAEEIIADATRAARDGMSNNDQRYSRFMGSNAWRKKLFEAAYKEFLEFKDRPAGTIVETNGRGNSTYPESPGAYGYQDEDEPYHPMDSIADARERFDSSEEGASISGGNSEQTREDEVEFQSPDDDDLDHRFENSPDPHDTDDEELYPGPEVEDDQPQPQHAAADPDPRPTSRPVVRPNFARPGQRAVTQPALNQDVFGEEEDHSDDGGFPSHMLDENDEFPAALADSRNVDPPSRTVARTVPERPPPNSRIPIGQMPARPPPMGTPVRRSFNTPLAFSSSHLAGKDQRG